MIDVQKATEIAVNYCRGIFPAMDRLRLEEVELSEDGLRWYITVGFDDPGQQLDRPLPLSGNPWTEALERLRPNPFGRQYKVVSLDAQSGNVQSVKIRQPLERVS